MSSTTKKRSERGLDYYRTPAWCVEAILPYLPMVNAIDPCCGDGAILEAMWNYGWHMSQLRGIEWDKPMARAASLKAMEVQENDALTCDWDGYTRLVVMNPPYVQAEAFVRKAISEAAPNRGTVAALLRLAFLEGKARVEFHREHPSDVYVLSKRPSFTGGKTDSCAYAWFVWGPGRGGRWQVL